MSKRKSNKAKAQKRHSTIRALQRFGISLDHKKAIEAIQGNTATFIERQSNRLTVWLIEQDSKRFPVVYDSTRKTIVTVLPNEWLKRQVEA